jgi:small subunit ribosomal protein S7
LAKKECRVCWIDKNKLIYIVLFIYNMSDALTRTCGFRVPRRSTGGECYAPYHYKKEGSKVPRKGHTPKRDVLPDPIYNDKVVTKLINNIMLDGKKGVAQRICYDAFDIIKEKTGKDPLEVFEQAMNNIMPVLEVKARRVGGATYQVPMEVRPERRQALGLRWLVSYARARGEKTMKERLAGEILDAVNNAGGAFKKKEDTHKMAEANRAFAHYRW